mmetsp:Transcript_44683/g.83433  ORF Transcript_44683/g.83433 Transcript_44683/m.83433 type:complete len:178 (-) Transcript_44683:8-541(-)
MAPHSAARRLLLSWCLAAAPFAFVSMPTWRQESVAKREAVARRGWADPDWNWGSPIGTAHNEAMALRERLASVRAREAWLQRLLAGEVDVEELKLALGLRIQHAARQGMDGDGAGWQLMQEMAACKYEGAGGNDKLKQDLDNLSSRLPDVSIDAAGDALGASGARALLGMGFAEGGL